jgi:hypothetical protein
MQAMGGNCGGVVASYVYLSRDGPRFGVGAWGFDGVCRVSCPALG